MGLVIVIEPHGTYAIYEQIVNQIKNQIISGELQPDEALPSIRGLAADIGVSVITTKHAYEPRHFHTDIQDSFQVCRLKVFHK